VLNFNNPFNQHGFPGSIQNQIAQQIAAAIRRCKDKFKNLNISDQHDGKKYLPRPEKRRVTWVHVADPKHRVRMWAYDLDTRQRVEVEVWETSTFGKNKDIAKGFDLDFKSGGILKRTKATTKTKNDSVILWDAY